MAFQDDESHHQASPKHFCMDWIHPRRGGSDQRQDSELHICSYSLATETPHEEGVKGTGRFWEGGEFCCTFTLTWRPSVLLVVTVITTSKVPRHPVSLSWICSCHKLVGWLCWRAWLQHVSAWVPDVMWLQSVLMHYCSCERSQIYWAYYPNVIMTNELARSVIIM